MTELHRWVLPNTASLSKIRRFHCSRKKAQCRPAAGKGYCPNDWNIGLTLGIGKGYWGVRNCFPLQGEFSRVGLDRGLRRDSHIQRLLEFQLGLSGTRWKSSRGLVEARAAGSPTPPRRSWFRRFLFESIEIPDLDIDHDIADELEIPRMYEDGIQFEERADAVVGEADAVDEMLENDRRFFRWKIKNEAQNDLRDYQASGADPDSRDWEDWLDDSWNQYGDNLAGRMDGWYEPSSNWEKDGVPRDPPSKPERGMKRTIKELLFRIFEPEDEVVDDLQFEERVFKFTSQTTAKFVGVLIFLPWITDFTIHDHVLVPFLQTYVEKVPLAAKILDVRESQKLKIIESLKLERQRLRFEAEIGKAPSLSDDELSEHIREEALELREEYRLENRQAFASLGSDFIAGLTILLLLVFNPQQVAIMRLTGERLFTNISDTGKAFIIILLTDIFLGYHSESGWETVSEMVLEHYGIEVSQAAIYIFVAIVPVTIDACFKLWVCN
uniref:Chloroplast envelope membrane protein n=1 Tax=Physcomitrium patens TaxID=3218 RepID=A0A7I3ZY05_PHYPA